MTVQNNLTLNQYTATSGQTVFTYTFEIEDQDNILVYQTPANTAPNDANDLLVLTTDYTVTGVGVETGGTIILVNPSPINDIITITSGVPPQRDTSFTPGGLIKAANLNTEFDNLVLILQRVITNQLKKTPMFMESAVVPAWNLILPTLAANQLWIANSAGTAITTFTFDINAIEAGIIALILAMLASHAPGQGASLIGLQNTGSVNNKTVQDLSEAQFLVNVSNGTTPNAQVLGNLATGIMKNAATTGLVSISAPLTSIDGLSTSANEILYTVSPNVYSTSGITAIGRSLLEDATQGEMNVTIGSLPLAGGTMIGDLFLNGPPAVASQAATKGYVDSVAENVQQAVLVSTTGNLAGYTYNNGASGVGATLTAGSNGAFVADGYVPALNGRVLVPLQTDATQNGIYTLTTAGDVSTPAVLTRSTDYDQPGEMQAGDRVTVLFGTAYGTTIWVMTQVAPITIGTTPITWGVAVGTPSNALLSPNNLSDVVSASQSRINLGLQIGVNVEAWSATLDALAPLVININSVLVSSNTGVPSFSTTLPSGLTIPGYQTSITGQALTKTDDTNVTLTLGGSPNSALLAATSLTLGWTGQLSLAKGGSNANLTASNGGIVYSTASEMAILAGTATAGLALLSGASTTPSWSTSAPITKVNVQLVTAAGAGTYTPTTGMQYVIIEAQAGGASGGGAAATGAAELAVAGGGGGGEYIRAFFTAAQIGASKAYVVGAGGAAPAAGNNPGNNGSNTTFNTTFIVTNGGLAGAGGFAIASATALLSSLGGAGGCAGSVATGVLIENNCGQMGETSINYGSNQGASGAGGMAGNGFPGGAGLFNAASTSGNNGGGGSGGGGGMTNNGAAVSGGAGGIGFIRFIEYCSS